MAPSYPINEAQDLASANCKQSSLIRSLSTRRGIFSHVTVEPATFCAVLALFIELPSVQDLIYTKICLENTANQTSQHPYHHSSLANNLNPATTPIRLNDYANSTNNYLPSNGRIQGDSNVIETIEVITHRDDPYGLLLCDRINKTRLAPQTRQSIENHYQKFWLTYQLIICLMCAFTAPYWGGISDRIGRLIPLNIPLLMASVSSGFYLCCGILASLGMESFYSVKWLYLCAILVGLSGGQAVVIVNSFGFVSDNSSLESRSKRIVILETVQNVGHSIGFMLAKYIMRMSLDINTNLPKWLNRHAIAFITCMLLNLSGILYSVIFLRHLKFHRFLNNFEQEQQETTAGNGYALKLDSVILQRSNNDASGVHQSTPRLYPVNSSSQANLDDALANDSDHKCLSVFWTLGYYKQTYTTLTKPREFRSIILLLLLCGFISSTSLALLISLLYIYLRANPFNMSTSDYSSWNMWTSINQGIALILLSLCMKFVRSWDVPDPLVASLGFLSKSLGLLMIGLAESSGVITWASLAFILSEFSMPPIRSLLSKLVVQDELGKVYSSLSALLSLCFVFTNIAFYLAFNTIEHRQFYRLSFLVVSGLQFGAFATMLYIYTRLRRKTIIV